MAARSGCDSVPHRSASSHARVSRPRWRIMAPKPPKDSGLCVALASPICECEGAHAPHLSQGHSCLWPLVAGRLCPPPVLPLVGCVCSHACRGAPCGWRANAGNTAWRIFEEGHPSLHDLRRESSILCMAAGCGARSCVFGSRHTSKPTRAPSPTSAAHPHLPSPLPQTDLHDVVPARLQGAT